jgi:hypothetical protein
MSSSYPLAIVETRKRITEETPDVSPSFPLDALQCPRWIVAPAPARCDGVPPTNAGFALALSNTALGLCRL